MDDRKALCHRPAMDTEMLIAEMNRLRDDLERAQAAKLVDYKALSQALGKNPTYVQQFVTKQSPRIMHAHLAAQIREKLAEAAKTGAKSPAGRSAQLAKTDDEIIGLLRRIDGFPEDALIPTLSTIRAILASGDASPSQPQRSGQHGSSIRPRAKAPSR